MEHPPDTRHSCPAVWAHVPADSPDDVDNVSPPASGGFTVKGHGAKLETVATAKGRCA
jgi:hypothetical protein